MKTKITSMWLGLIVLLFSATGTLAQQTLKLETKPTLKLSGTSSLHDWEMTSNEATGTLVAETKSGRISKIVSLTVEMPSESIKSGKKGMDKNAYKAIKTTDYKSVKFEAKQATQTASGWSIRGNFTLAGVTKEITVQAKETSAGGAYNLSGEYNFKLTEYNIKPPTALMGAIKTGDAVKILISISFK